MPFFFYAQQIAMTYAASTLHTFRPTETANDGGVALIQAFKYKSQFIGKHD
jgi:hypothetical protein